MHKLTRATGREHFVDAEYKHGDTWVEEGPIIDQSNSEYLTKNYASSIEYFRQRYISSPLLTRAYAGENIYWDPQSMSYMMTGLLWRMFVKMVATENIDTSIFVDATASVGGVAIRAALRHRARSLASSVIAYEIDCGRYRMLLNAARLHSVKIVARNWAFDYKIPTGATVFIDPPFESGVCKCMNLSIDSVPVCEVARQCISAGASTVILNMPADYRFNSKFASDNRLDVVAYTTGKRVKWYIIRARV